MKSEEQYIEYRSKVIYDQLVENYTMEELEKFIEPVFKEVICDKRRKIKYIKVHPSLKVNLVPKKYKNCDIRYIVETRGEQFWGDRKVYYYTEEEFVYRIANLLGNLKSKQKWIKVCKLSNITKLEYVFSFQEFISKCVKSLTKKGVATDVCIW